MACNHEWTEREGFRKSVDDWGRFSEKWQRRKCLKCGAVEERPKPNSVDKHKAKIAELQAKLASAVEVMKDAKIVIERAIALTTSGADHNDLCTVRNRIDKALIGEGE